MTLHLSQIFRTDARTFIALSLFIPISYAPAIQIIRRKLNQNSIARKNTNEVFAHFAGNVRQYLVPVFFQLDPKHRVRQCFKDFRHELYRFFLRHTERQTQICLCWQTSNTNMRLYQCQADGTTSAFGTLNLTQRSRSSPPPQRSSPQKLAPRAPRL